MVGRGGNLWFGSIPLKAGTNHFSIMALNAAGNMSTTNFNVVQSSVKLTVDLWSDLNYAFGTVSGTVDDPDVTSLFRAT